MKLNIKTIAPLLVAGAIVLDGCQSVHGQAINENNIDSDNDTTIEFNIDDEDYVSSDDWKVIASDNIERSIYGVSKNLVLNEENAARYLHGLTGSDITFQDCEDFYINRFEAIDDRIGTLVTTDTLYVDHNMVCRVCKTLEADSLVDDEDNNISVIDLLEQGVDIEDIDLEDTETRTDVYSHIYQDNNVTINSTDFTTEYEIIEHLNKDTFFGELKCYPSFVNSIGSHEDMHYEIDSYDEDDEYVVIRRAICGPDGELAKESSFYFCDDELLLGHTGDYNLLVYLPGDNEYAYLDDVQRINEYLDRTYSSNEQLFTVQVDPGYTEEYSGKYGVEDTYDHSLVLANNLANK